MLVICKRISIPRPKYHPVNRHPFWVVVDSTTKETVHGPTTRDACQRYLDKETNQ